MGHTIRANDILARFGGEEFVIIMPDTPETTAFKIAERIRNAIKNFIQPEWKHFPKKQITVCIGISAYYDCREPIENVIERADSALSRAKLLGKDCTVSHTNHFVKSPGAINKPKRMPGKERGLRYGVPGRPAATSGGNMQGKKCG
jgi:predicted signal transduction protein with EAL and GGDEF domain